MHELPQFIFKQATVLLALVGAMDFLLYAFPWEHGCFDVRPWPFNLGIDILIPVGIVWALSLGLFLMSRKFGLANRT